MKKQIHELIRKEVREQHAYVADISSCSIKLDANENPFSLPSELHNEFIESLGRVSLNRYPEPGSMFLLGKFAEKYGVEACMIMLGNGSDELIQILCTAMEKTNVLVPVPTFVMYRISGLNNGHGVVEVPLDSEFDLDLPSMLKQMQIWSPSLVFLSYPNNPTGNCFSPEKMEAILEKAPGLVVVDEAYGNFSSLSFLPLLKQYENLIVLKTLSKIGLAALRIGFLIGAPTAVQELNKVRLPYNLNTLSQVAAGFYLDHEQVFLDQAAMIIRERERLYNELQGIDGIYPYPSDANFVFFRCLFDTDNVYGELKRQKILIKNFNSTPPLENCMRVTVGNERENDAFLEALKRIIAK